MIWAQPPPGKLIARVEIADAAHDIGLQEKSIGAAGGEPNPLSMQSPADTQSGKPPTFLFAGMPRLTAAQLPAAGPTISPPPPMEGTAEELAVPPYPANDGLPFDDNRDGGLQLIEPPLPLHGDTFKPSPAAEFRSALRGTRWRWAIFPKRWPDSANISACNPTITRPVTNTRGCCYRIVNSPTRKKQLERLVAEQPTIGTYRLLLADVLLQLKSYDSPRAVPAVAFRSSLRRPGRDHDGPVVPGRASHRQRAEGV